MTNPILKDPVACPIGSVQELGIEIRATDAVNGRHVAIIYRVDEKDEPVLCHLRWHHFLRLNEKPTGANPWLQSPLGPATRRAIAGFCKSMADRVQSGSPKLNFGFSVYLDCINRDGRFLPLDDGRGLTCATFVLEVFKKRGIDLLSVGEWPKRDDDLLWKEKILSELQGNQKELQEAGKKAAAEAVGRHIEGLRIHIDAPRFRPEEVAAGAQHKPTPMSFSQAEGVGKKILRELFPRYVPAATGCG